ncbi:hypothetical protein RW26_16530 [Aeromonas sp. L_1B5_3]|nr:hypothetical protein RW26_16530 [Aeromonas sp. L_1B5_3]
MRISPDLGYRAVSCIRSKGERHKQQEGRRGEKAEADPNWRKRAARFAQIKKSRRYRNDKAGSSNKEWLYKQMLYSKD